MTWKDGRLSLPDGSALVVEASTAVAFEDGALVLRGVLAAGRGDATLTMTIRHAHTTLFVPHLTPEEGQVIGDAVFRAPAVVLASETLALALVVDVDEVGRARGWRTWLDIDATKQTITLAAGAFHAEGHVFYRREPFVGSGESATLRIFVRASVEREDIDNPYGLAADWLWQKWGAPVLEASPAPPTREAMQHVAHWAFASEWSESVWQPVDLGNGIEAGAPVFIVDVSRHPSVPREHRRWREPRSIWNQAWFSTQRCANGLLRYARAIDSDMLEARARAMTEIALAAPMVDGLFPSVLVAEDRESERGGAWRWTSSDRRPAEASAEACHIVDAAFTCRMLCEWSSLTGDVRARERVDQFIERLVRLQRPSGAFPGWVEPNGHVVDVLAEGPESAMSVALLFELGRVEPAMRGVRFLEEIARVGRWEDFETYFSCAPWGTPGARVARNGVYKQNTLSIAWTADAFLRGWQVTRDPHWLRLARRCIDELSLYQAVWNPPFLPAVAHGGFGVMNGDSEWNDARQSLFAPLYLEMARATGDPELFERGVSAVRASFAMLFAPQNPKLVEATKKRFPFFGEESYGFMMENQGHGVADPIGTFTIFSWGNGSALATAALVREQFPEARALCGLT